MISSGRFWNRIDNKEVEHLKELYADIIVDISHEKLDKTFQYRVPEKLMEVLEPGMCVQIPFGKGNRLIKGYVVAMTFECSFDPQKMKEIAGLATGEADVTHRMIALAAWMRKQYGSTMIQSLKTVLPARHTVGKLEHKYVEVLMNKEELRSLLGESIRKKQAGRIRLLTALVEDMDGIIPLSFLTGKLNIAPATVTSLCRDGAIRVFASESYRNPVKCDSAGHREISLSEEQKLVVKSVLEEFDAGKRGTYLVHGITGSGKTQVYIRLAEEIVARGKQVIVLIPEIALTYQTLLRFYSRFGDRVSVLNSTLSPGERYDQCERAKNGEIDVIIGPRSALFTPFPNVGLIVMDEEHEGSYKSESMPKYHARETALEVARLHNASVVLGSATPSMEAYYRALKGEYRLFTLTKRLTGGCIPQVSIVDLREELKSGNRSIFSRKLQDLLTDRLQKGQQSILFLNRRGYAGFVSCRACGEVMKCPHCDVSLSEHFGEQLVCHYCGYTTRKPAACPKCGSKYLLGFRAGTQQIEEKLKELFPGIRTLRMDGDTTKKKGSYEAILSDFAEGKADVLIGTQMIVKGHDFPNVTLVGVLAADISLGANDYRSGERTFQLLTQAVGRAGRGELPGEAVIQTYQPEHYAVLHAAAQDYVAFYEEEILYRELGGYPPAAHMLAIQIFAQDMSEGEQVANRLAEIVKRGSVNLRVLGPAPASIGKINDVYRFVIYVKGNDSDELVRVKDVCEMNFDEQLSPRVQLQFDFDPMNCM